MKEREPSGADVGFGCFIGVLVGGTIMCLVMLALWKSSEKELREEAIKRGVAEYYIKDSATVGFRWIEPTP